MGAKLKNRQAKSDAPPIVGKCPTCGTAFASMYDAKRHECAPKPERADG